MFAACRPRISSWFPWTASKVKLSDFRGKAVVLNFWATWCAPCKVEMPWFVDLQKQYASDGLTIVGVAMDDS